MLNVKLNSYQRRLYEFLYVSIVCFNKQYDGNNINFSVKKIQFVFEFLILLTAQIYIYNII